jgi:hypothetical protein
MVCPQPPDSLSPPRVTVVRADRGWEVREKTDDGRVRVTRYTDWHHVELSVRRVESQDASRPRGQSPK